MAEDNEDIIESEDNSYMFVDEDKEEKIKSRGSKPKGRYFDEKIAGEIQEESTIDLVADEDVSKELSNPLTQEVSEQMSFSEKLERRAENISEAFDNGIDRNKDDINSVALSNDKVITKGKGFGVAALVCGVLSLTFFCSFINIFTSILSLAFGVVQLRRGTAKAMAVIGIICSVCSVILLFICMNVVMTNQAFIEMLTNGILSSGI